MDANGLKFWMLAEDRDWSGLDCLEYESSHRVLRLANQRQAPDWPASEPLALSLLDRVPGSIDNFGMRAFLSPAGSVMGTGVAPDPIPLFKPAGTDAVTDITLGYDGMLYLAVAGTITVIDLRGRLGPVPAAFPDPPPQFTAWRLAANSSGGAWALDPTNNKLARVSGLPLFVQPHPPYGPNTVRPCQENADPPRLLIEHAAIWPANERAVAIAASPQGLLALLTWTGSTSTPGSANLRILSSDGILGTPIALAGALRPYSFTWISPSMIALMLPGMPEALAYQVVGSRAKVLPSGDVFTLRDHDGGPFLHGINLPPSYPTTSGASPLVRLSLPQYAYTGKADGALLIDSGNPSTAWHRLYLEAMIPDACGVIVHLAAVNDKDSVPAQSQWFPHRFGRKFAPDGKTPRGAWVPASSEIPFHPGVLDCPRDPNRSGLFTALIQRTGPKTRTLRGRYLKVRIELVGNGRSSPQIAASRVYASRFSYVENYLPELYREAVFAPDADTSADQTTPADFLERFLGNFEGVLTPLEDKIADAHLVTVAESAPEEALEWLGSWIGVAFDSAYSTQQRRLLLGSAPELYRSRGTVAGLSLALDIATGGAVSSRQIVILEDWRLRRTFATIVGANLADQDDPLLAGLASSGNSFVGDTLFLGNEGKKEFLALFSAALAKTADEQAAVDAFFDNFAYRITVLVHQEINAQDFGLIRRIVSLEAPAHVLARVVTATQPFLVQIASILGVDTYLAPKPFRQPARVNVSYLSRDFVEGVASLDPRLSGAVLPSQPPIAAISSPPLVEPAESFQLDGSASRAAEGKKIVRYIWTLLNNA